MKELGTRVKQLREKKRWSQDVLAKKSGTSAPTIQRLEFGSGKVGYITLFKIADALNVSIDYLKTGTESKAPELKEIEQLFNRLLKKISKEQFQALIEEGYPVPKEVNIFFNSDNIPTEDKEGLLRQIRNLLKMYHADESGDPG